MNRSLGLIVGLVVAALGTHADAHPAGSDHETSDALGTFFKSVAPQAVLQPGGVIHCVCVPPDNMQSMTTQRLRFDSSLVVFREDAAGVQIASPTFA